MDSYQEAEWKKAQAINISCDLVAAAKQQLALLVFVNQHPCLYQGPAVERAIHRYENFWLPLLASAGANAGLVPPLDCEWVWLCHRLNPVQYAKDCNKLYGRLLNATTISLHERDSAISATAKIWEKAYASEPFALDLNAFSSKRANRVQQHHLLEAISRQRSFLQQVSSAYMSDERFLRAAEQRYRGYLYLAKKSKSPKSFHVPTYDIELMWRSHQLNPEAYGEDTVELLGELLEYDVDSKGIFPETKKQWENTFGRRYLRAGAIHKANQQPPNSCPESLQVMLEIMRARHIREEKGSLFVRCYVQNSGGIIKMNTKQLSAISNPEWREAFSLECRSFNGDLVSELEAQFLVCEVRWRSESLWGKVRGSQLIGSVRIAWRDLLESDSLSMENWFPLAVRGQLKDDLKPPSLHVALSLTPLVKSSLPTIEKSLNGGKICPVATKGGSFMGTSCERSRNVVKRQSRSLERDECACRGHICNYEGVMSFGDAAWGI